jgi:hypothetical protein
MIAMAPAGSRSARSAVARWRGRRAGLEDAGGGVVGGLELGGRVLAVARSARSTSTRRRRWGKVVAELTGHSWHRELVSGALHFGAGQLLVSSKPLTLYQQGSSQATTA